jgi:serine protease Do
MLRRLLRTSLALVALGFGLGLGLAAGLRFVAPPLPMPTVFAAMPGLPGPDFTSIARSATPAVVNISALQVVRAQRSPFDFDPFFQFFGRDFPFRVPLEERKLSLGSGVIVSTDGLVVTNHHVVQNARQIAITTSDRRRLRGELIGSDPVTDVALVRVESHGLSALGWGDSSQAAVGEYVLAIGNPFQLNQTVTMGIISATGRSSVGVADYEDFIQTDAAINPGNSGGALVNARGELIGINTAIYSETGGYQGIGFAVPSNLARRVADQLAAYGRVRRGWVGITQVRALDEALARDLGLSDSRGAVVWELLRGSPADRAGVEPGDVVVSINSVPVEDVGQLRNAIAGAEVGAELSLTVLRKGRRQVLRIPVEEQRTRD